MPTALHLLADATAVSTTITILFTIALIGGVFWVVIIGEKKRAAAMRVAAGELSLRYHEKGEIMSPSVIGHLHLGQQGHSPRVRNSMSGRAGDIDVTLFDYTFTVGHGQHQNSHTTTAVRLVGQGPGWPAFEMRPEGVFSKLGAALGGQDIDFDSHPKFSKHFVLKGDEAAIRAFFDASLLTDLEGRENFCAEGRGNEMIYYRKYKPVKAPELRGLLADAHGVFVLFADAAKRAAGS